MIKNSKITASNDVNSDAVILLCMSLPAIFAAIQK